MRKDYFQVLCICILIITVCFFQVLVNKATVLSLYKPIVQLCIDTKNYLNKNHCNVNKLVIEIS